MRGRAPNYPGLDDPRAAMLEFVAAYHYVGTLKSRFHISSPAYEVLSEISEAMRRAATALTLDPYFFGGIPCGQSIYVPPAAPPIPGIVRAPLAKGSGRRHPT